MHRKCSNYDVIIDITLCLCNFAIQLLLLLYNRDYLAIIFKVPLDLEVATKRDIDVFKTNRAPGIWNNYVPSCQTALIYQDSLIKSGQNKFPKYGF